MRVVVANLTHGGLSGGSRKYLLRALPLLGRDPRIEQLDVFVPPTFQRELSTRINLPVQTWPAGDPGRAFAALAGQLRHAPPDVVFIPGARALPIDRIPQVIMVRNMEPPTIPFFQNTLFESIRNIARNAQAARACRRARMVIAVSNYVSDFLRQRWRLPSEKICRIYHGADPADPAEPESIAAEGSENTTRAAGVVSADQPFLFTAGSIRPARGLEDLVTAFGRVADQIPRLTLVIAGGVDPGMRSYACRLRRLAAAHGIESRIAWPGRLNSDEMAWHFRHCRAFVMTSRAEACPNTALESLAHGCTIVSTSTDPMPEFYRGHARYYAPADAESLARVLRETLAEDRGPDDPRRLACQARAAEFTWSRTALETVDLLERVAQERIPIRA